MRNFIRPESFGRMDRARVVFVTKVAKQRKRNETIRSYNFAIFASAPEVFLIVDKT